MEYALLLLAILIFTVQTICFKEFNRSFMKNLASYFLFNSLYFSLIVLIVTVTGLNLAAIHTVTALLALGFGILFVTVILLYMKAMENGPLSYTSLVFSLGLIVPTLSGVVFWNEKIGILQIAGLIILFVTFYLGSGATSDAKGKINLKWLIYCTTAFIGNGTIMTLSKAQQMLTPGKEINEFLFLGFGTAAVLSIILFLRQKVLKGESVSHLKTVPFGVVVLITGFVTAVGNQIAVFLAGRLPAVIQFPVANGGIVLLSSIVSITFFREKLSRKGAAGLILGFVSLVLLSVP